MRIFYTEEFRRDVKKIKERDVLERLKKIIEHLRENPQTGKPLRYSLTGLRSIKMGKFRVIYKIEGDKIILLKIGHRKSVYKS